MRRTRYGLVRAKLASASTPNAISLDEHYPARAAWIAGSSNPTSIDYKVYRALMTLHGKRSDDPTKDYILNAEDLE